MYTLRYKPGTDLNDRKHKYTKVQADTFTEALNALDDIPEYYANKLEVVKR